MREHVSLEQAHVEIAQRGERRTARDGAASSGGGVLVGSDGFQSVQRTLGGGERVASQALGFLRARLGEGGQRSFDTVPERLVVSRASAEIALHVAHERVGSV